MIFLLFLIIITLLLALFNIFMSQVTLPGVVRRYGPLLARILIGGMFLYNGIIKISGFEGTVGYINSVNLPSPEILAVIALIIEIACGLLLILGYRIAKAATVLVVFTVLATIFFHSNTSDPMQFVLMTKNLAIIGGLLYMMTFGAGHITIESMRGSTS